MSDEAVEAVAAIIYEAMRFDKMDFTPEWEHMAEEEARAKAIRALAAARPFHFEEAARIAEGRGHNVKLFHDQPAERFASTSEIAAAIRAAKETGDE